jgi:hypothetical protein
VLCHLLCLYQCFADNAASIFRAWLVAQHNNPEDCNLNTFVIYDIKDFTVCISVLCL